MIIDLASKELGLSRDYLDKVTRSASYRYKSYPIDKKTGGTRIIHHPAPEVKMLQRWLSNKIFCVFPVHRSVFSYRRNLSITDHARQHVANNYLLRVDLKEFFPSITSNDIRKLLAENKDEIPADIGEKDCTDICKIVCRHGRLTIGAPSSPILSNAVLYAVDCVIEELCRNSPVTYTRYADDLYFSSDKKGVLAPILEEVRKIIQENDSPKLEINDHKTVFTSRKRRRVVTGIFLSSDRKISLGRKRKRMMRVGVFQDSKGELSTKETSRLRGLLAWAYSVEPEFVLRLSEKYPASKSVREIIGG